MVTKRTNIDTKGTTMSDDTYTSLDVRWGDLDSWEEFRTIAEVLQIGYGVSVDKKEYLSWPESTRELVKKANREENKFAEWDADPDGTLNISSNSNKDVKTMKIIATVQVFSIREEVPKSKYDPREIG